MRRRLRGVACRCSSPPWGRAPMLVAAGSCGGNAGSSLLGCILRVGLQLGAGCCSWSRGRAAFCAVLHGRAALSNIISGRVGSGQPNSYRAKRKAKKPIIFRHDRHGTAIRNPPRHHYLGAFFQIFAMPNRHGTAIATI